MTPHTAEDGGREVDDALVRRERDDGHGRDEVVFVAVSVLWRSVPVPAPVIDVSAEYLTVNRKSITSSFTDFVPAMSGNV